MDFRSYKLFSIDYQMISNSFSSPNHVVYQKRDPLSDEILQKSSQMDIIPQFQEIPKKKLNSIIFLLNIFWMLCTCCTIVYSVFSPPQKNEIKGKIAGFTLGLTIIISFPTFFYLSTLKKWQKLAFLLDTIMLVSIATSIAFFNIISIFDHVGKWYFDLIKIGFIFEIFCYSTMVRVMLVTLDWEKSEVIVFKLHFIVNCLVFFLCGITFIWLYFSYTYRMMPAYDNKVHDFMVLFIFTVFGCVYQFYNKTSDLDHTGDLKFVYRMKNADETRSIKKKQITKQKRDSINSIKILETNKKVEFSLKVYECSRCAQIATSLPD